MPEYHDEHILEMLIMQNVRKSTDYVDRRKILCEVHFKHRCGHWSMRGICLILYIYHSVPRLFDLSHPYHTVFWYRETNR